MKSVFKPCLTLYFSLYDMLFFVCFQPQFPVPGSPNHSWEKFPYFLDPLTKMLPL